jgi:hypothetical protein
MKILQFLVGGVLFMVLLGQVKSFFHQDPKFQTEHEMTLLLDEKRKRNVALGLIGTLGLIAAAGYGVYRLSKRK